MADPNSALPFEKHGPSALDGLPKHLNMDMPPDGSPGCLYLGKLCWPDGDGRMPTGDDLAEFNRLIGDLVEGGYVLGVIADVVFVPLADAQEGRPVPVSLPANTRIVVRGRDRLQPGDRISISE